jgi:cell fate regulator YaaT (PSP1 superfamily)
MTDTSASKPKQPRTKKFMLVRYGRMRLLGLFEHNETQIPSTPMRAVVKTEKGLELGSIVGQLSTYRGGQVKLSDEQLKKYFDESEVPFSLEPVGRFVRYATTEDINEEKHFLKIARDEAKFCRKLVKELNLPMDVVDAEHIFGGERIVFYFMSDGRVDFRELVKRLAQEYQTRIEMRQIGSRDEAKILGDVESCGQQCCCIRFLKSLKPVNMRMAKLQKATLDPSKISGYCGRLKCCLRYEDQTYTELKRKMPPRSTRVKTPDGLGRIVDYQILAQLVMIELDNGTRTVVPREELEIISLPPGQSFHDEPRAAREAEPRAASESEPPATSETEPPAADETEPPAENEQEPETTDTEENTDDKQ